MVKKIEISYKTIVFIFLFMLALGFLYLIKDILLMLFVAILIMATLNPVVTKLNKYKIPRPLAVLLVYFVFFAVVGLSVGVIIPILIEQTNLFVVNLPHTLKSLSDSSSFADLIIKALISEVGSLSGQVAKLTLSLFSNIIEIFSVVILSFYLILARDRLDGQMSYLVGEDNDGKVEKFVSSLEVKLGGWARGQLILMIVIGVTTYVGLTIIGMPYALPLAILAGILEIVPTMGPIIAAIPPAIIGFGVSPIVGVASIALAFLIQQFENYVLVPRVMQASAGVSPISTLLSLAVGFRIAGIAGAVIAVPIFITLQFVLKQFFFQKSK